MISTRSCYGILTKADFKREMERKMASWTKSQLPTPTNDLDKVANDIDQWGYGLLEDALSAVSYTHLTLPTSLAV